MDLVACGAPAACARALKQHPTVPGVVEAAARCLQNLSCNGVSIDPQGSCVCVCVCVFVCLCVCLYVCACVSRQADITRGRRRRAAQSWRVGRNGGDGGRASTQH